MGNRKIKSHFSLEEWADFRLRRTPPEARAKMQDHLDGGCRRCAGTLELWNRVLEIAGREGAFEPPADAVRCARALYNAFPPRPRRRLNLRIAQLAGFGQPALEGARATGVRTSHFLFKEGNLLLDMHLEARTAPGLVSMVGQVLNPTRPDTRFETRPVSIMREKVALARTTTNQFGEFHLEYEPDQDLLLVIELEKKSYLVSRLPVLPEE